MHPRLLLTGAGVLIVLGAAVVSLPERRPHIRPAGGRTAEQSFGTRDEPIRPIPPSTFVDARKMKLGRVLFHDPRLSVDGSVSCASCHDLQQGGDDGRALSIGIHGRLTKRNSPTVFNAVHNFRQFWDGRAESLEAQVEHALLADTKMGWRSWADLVSSLDDEADLVAAFSSIYEQGLTREALVDALGNFGSSLVTRGAPFDFWLLGDDAALTDEEIEGYELFKSVGCIACHQGKNVGGNLFQRIGRIESTEFERGIDADEHLGRFEVTGNERDRYRFKVPSLRNVELTSPYLHDGSIAELREVIRFMARHQLGEELSESEVDSIRAFLLTLTGELPPSASR